MNDVTKPFPPDYLENNLQKELAEGSTEQVVHYQNYLLAMRAERKMLNQDDSDILKAMELVKVEVQKRIKSGEIYIFIDPIHNTQTTLH